MVNDNQTHSITMQVNSIYRCINKFMASPNSKLVIGKREIIQLIYMWFKVNRVISHLISKLWKR